MDASTGPLHPDSAGPAGPADKTPDSIPEALQELFDSLRADYNAPRSGPDLEDDETARRILGSMRSAMRAGRAAQGSGDGQ